MSPYARAARHARWMLGVLALTILGVAAAEVYVGHSNVVFAAAIIALGSGPIKSLAQAAFG